MMKDGIFISVTIESGKGGIKIRKRIIMNKVGSHSANVVLEQQNNTMEIGAAIMVDGSLWLGGQWFWDSCPFTGYIFE